MRDLRFLNRSLALLGGTVCLASSLIFIVPRLLDWALLPDFTVFWTAGRFALDGLGPYDTQALTAAQSWAVDPGRGARPFPYPPSALLFFAPFAFMPFWLAYWAWLGLSALLFWSSARRVATGWAVTLSLLSPHVVLVLILGQTTLVIGSLIIWALTLIRDRPILAGTLLGIAAAFKPQSVLLAPIALASGRHWHALAASVVAFFVIYLASLVLGSNLWFDWFAALSAFPKALEEYGLHSLGATPWMAGRTLGFDPVASLLVQVAGVVAGVAVAWYAFRSDDVCGRLLGLVGGGLLASPYAMRYDLATLAPVLAAGLFGGKARGLLVSAPLFALKSVTIVPAVIVSLGAQFLYKDRSPEPDGSFERS